MKKLFLFFFLLLPFYFSCASFWPWMYGKRVIEEEEAQQEPPKKNVIGRVFHRREKGFDYNQDGQISSEERKFFLKMRETREQEKILRGEK